MKRFSKGQTINFYSSTNKPKYFINLDESVIVEVNDCYDGQIKTEKDLRSNIDIEKMNLATGPIYIDSLKSGDTLCIEIIDIQINDYGIMVVSPGLGPLGSHVIKPSTKIVPIINDQVIFNGNIVIQTTPMIGVIGVAPKVGEIHTSIPGSHGGNLDTKDIKSGNKIYFPVFVDGALVAIGDLHGAMGDGELSGTGLETSGEVTVKFTKHESVIQNPLIEDDSSFYFIASDTTYDKAINTALFNAVECIKNKRGLTFEDSYRLLSLACDLKVSQIVNKLVTVRVMVPKIILPSV